MKSQNAILVFFMIGMLLPMYFFGPIFFFRLVTGVTFLDPLYNQFSGTVFGFSPMVGIIFGIIGGLVYSKIIKKEK